MKNETKKKIAYPLMAAVLMTGMGASMFYAPAASAATAGVTTSLTPSSHQGGRGHGGMKPGVVGTVTAINGTSITLTGKNSTVYTVEAGAAKIMKMPAMPSTPPAAGSARPAPAVIAVSDIQPGDTLMVQGTVSGTSVTATNIMDGKFMGKGGASHSLSGPHVSGTITAINGNSITVNDVHGTGAPVVYTVDVTNAKITERGSGGTAPAVVTPASLAIGNRVMVQGTVSGTSVAATSVMTGTWTVRAKAPASVASAQ